MNTPEEKSEKQYDRALTLIQYYVQLTWLIFGAFLLAETVLVAAAATVAKDAPALVFFGSLLGLALALPWWASFRYNHALYLLRVFEARSLEPAVGTFFTTGNQLIKGAKLFEGEVQIPKVARALSPRKSCTMLILTFVIVFVALAVAYRPGKW